MESAGATIVPAPEGPDAVDMTMGAHIDGFIAVVAHTLVIGATADSPVTGKKADAMLAAHLASEAALRLVKPGNESYEVTETVAKIGEAFDCKPVEGMLSHQVWTVVCCTFIIY